MSERMTIGFLGAGAMTRALAPGWRQAGHDIVIGGRDPDRTAALAEHLEVRAATLAEAAEQCDVAVLAVRWEGVRWTLEQVGGRLDGKPLIDVTNPVEVERFHLTTPPGESLAEQVQAVSGACVVKAFNLAEASVWTSPRWVDGRPLTVPVATNHAEARAVVERLAGAHGLEVLDAGGLAHARYLEAMAAVVIRRLFSGDSPSSTFAWVA